MNRLLLHFPAMAIGLLLIVAMGVFAILRDLFGFACHGLRDPFSRLLLVLFFGASMAGGQTIATKVLSAGTAIRIVLSPTLTTTLLFPGPLSGTFGLGLVGGNNTQTAPSGGMVQVEHPDGSNVLVLHALTETAHVLATVLLDGKLYVFNLECGAAPDVAVTLVKTDPTTVQAQTVTADQVKLARPKYDP
jgi:hypothetical protein